VSARGRRSLVDELVEGDHDHRPPHIQEALRRIANNRLLTFEEKHRRAQCVLEEQAARRG
jgi:hypothetical protein